MPAKRKSRSLSVRKKDSTALQAKELKELIDTFLERRSEHTRLAYQMDLQDFAGFLNRAYQAKIPLLEEYDNRRGKKVKRFNLQRAIDFFLASGPAKGNSIALRWYKDMEKRGLSTASCNRRLAALRSILRLARTVGLATWIVEIQTEKSESYQDTKGPPKRDVRKLFAVAKTRDRLILHLLYTQALRRGEVSGLNFGDYDPEGGRLAIKGKGKSSKQWITLAPVTKETLEKWLDERGREKGPLLTCVKGPHAGKGKRLTGNSIRYIVQVLSKKAGLEKPIKPHGLRHSAITEALKRTHGNVVQVRKFSRHADIGTVLIYDDCIKDFYGAIAGALGDDLDDPDDSEWHEMYPPIPDSGGGHSTDRPLNASLRQSSCVEFRARLSGRGLR